jgi:copper chaperone NosL
MRSRLLLALAAVLLIPVFVLPLWSIRIVAPQYNDGLGMFIGLRDIWGHGEHDIQNINILNHYIGMKPIVPADVGVLQIMPIVVGLLIITALVAALANRRWVTGMWLVLFAVLGTAGMYEFYSWNYDYGHNLSPDAPIKVPGMTYVPPLIGTKTLLTIRASSWPSWGTLFMMLSLAAGFAALLSGWRGRAGRRTADAGSASGAGEAIGRSGGGGADRAGGAGGALTAAVLALVLVAGCGTAAGDDTRTGRTAEFAPDGGACAFCDGEIPAERFGGELVTAGGETHRFMSVECLAGFVVSGRVPADEILSMHVVDYNDGERLIDARSALYVRSDQRRSPNGLDLLASDSEKIAYNLHFFFGGTRLAWPDVLELVRKEWSL